MPGYEVSTWHSICGPGRVAQPVVSLPPLEIVATIRAEETRHRLEAIGAELVASTPQELRDLIDREVSRWEKLIVAMGLKEK